MKVVVVGSGLLGLTTAYFLRTRGREVTVFDRAEGPGLETSFANAGLLTPSMAQPWNAPGSWRVLLSSLGRSDSPMQLRLKALPALAGWGARFLANSRAKAFKRNTQSNLRLALYSQKLMESLRHETNVEYGRSARGALSVFRDPMALERATEAARQLASSGVTFRRLSTDETVALEPVLGPIASELTGGIHFPIDETGDAYRFCTGLAEHAKGVGVEFHFRTEVTGLAMRGGHISAVVTERGRFEADQYVVAAGSYSTPLLATVGLSLPVRPVKGYSVTFDNPGNRCPLTIPIADYALHAVVTPLPGVIRVAGTAEFAGFDHRPNQARIRNLVDLVRRILPQAPLDLTTARPWCGLRAMSADGVPIIGPTPLSNLFVNTGHGHLGWTMTAGSAQLLTDLITGRSAGIDPAPYDSHRFG
jgi:D-amino-acid dehydrogenase